MYVNIHELNPWRGEHQIDYYSSMWTTNRFEKILDNGIVTKTGCFKERAIMQEKRMAIADINEFPEIYRIFLLHQFNKMNNSLGEYYGQLAPEF